MYGMVITVDNTILYIWKLQGKQILFSWAPKSLWLVTTAMKFKDACSLGGKLCQT